MSSAILIIVAVLLGLSCFWLFLGRKNSSADASPLLAEVKEQLARRETDLAAARTSAAELGSAKAGAEASREAAERALAEFRQQAQQAVTESDAQLRQLRGQKEDLAGKLAAAEAQLQSERETSGLLRSTLADERIAHAKAGERSEHELSAVRTQLSDREKDLATANASAKSERENGEALKASLAEAKREGANAAAQAAKDADTLRRELTRKGEQLVQAQGELTAIQALLSTERETTAALRASALEDRALHQKAAEQLTREAAGLREKLTAMQQELATSTANLASERTAYATLKTASEDAKRRAEQAGAEAGQLETALRTELKTVREQLTASQTELAGTQAQLKSERQTGSEGRELLAIVRQTLTRTQDDLVAARTAGGAAEAEVKLLKERLETERQQLAGMQEKIRQEFEGISNKLLVDSSSRFNQQSSESLEKLLGPLKENLTTFKTALDSTKQEAAVQSELLKQHIERMSTDAGNLVKALKGDSKVLGNWGENMLDQLLEKSGLQRDVHYRRQQVSRDAEGDRRFLDVIIDLPDGRHLVIDSKASLRSYEEAVNLTDETARELALNAHVEALRKHARDLENKSYQSLYNINAPDFVLMYIPVEAAYLSALSRVPGLFAEALDRKVVMITNSSLLGTLRTVSHVWQLAVQHKNAMEIADRGGKLYDKFVGFVKDLDAVGKSIADAHSAWGEANKKLHVGSGNLVGQAVKLRELGAKISKALPAQLVEKALEVREASPALPAGEAAASQNLPELN